MIDTISIAQLKIDVVNEVKSRLSRLSKQTGLITGMARSVSDSVFRLIEDKRIDNVLTLCEQLLAERKWELSVVAYDWTYRVRKQYGEGTFDIFEGWLKKYVSGWGDCDDFCTHAFGELLSQYNGLFKQVVKWTEHPDFWVRRASAVILIYPIKKGQWQGLDPYLIADKLMNDDHYLVLKGYGWMLKVLSCVRPDEVCAYLEKNRKVMPRISFRYALEKLDKARKTALMHDSQESYEV